MAAPAHSPTGMPEKDLYRIGEVSQITSTKSFVLRYWETEFPMLQPVKSPSGHRMYRREDIETVLKIKRLLYEEGFTIAGARKHLAGAAGANLDRPGNDQPSGERSSVERLNVERPSNDRVSAPAATGRPSFATNVPFSSSPAPSAAQHTHRGAESAQASFLDNVHESLDDVHAVLDDQSASDNALLDEPLSLEELAQPEPEPPMAADFDLDAPIALEDMQAQFISRDAPFSEEQIPTYELQPAPEGLNFSPPPAASAPQVAETQISAAPAGLSEEQRMCLLDVREELRAILTLLERE
jgi:DNA-binding transcriptional MerR regulator